MDLVNAHKPVLLDEVLSFMDLDESEACGARQLVLDCTVGGAGHSQAVLERNKGVYLVGLDRDAEGLKLAAEKLAPYRGRFQLIHGNFADLDRCLLKATLSELGIRGSNAAVVGLKEQGASESGTEEGSFPREAFQRILVDLGISSNQLDRADRGFSFMKDGPLDMRMDRSESVTAADILNNSSFAELRRIFSEGGLRQDAALLAKEVVNSRPLESTSQFSAVCERVLGFRRYKKSSSGSKLSGRGAAHPATVPFQALRIAVNKEFDAIKSFLAQVMEHLAPGGRLLMISFHSLEDRFVTNWMRGGSRAEMLPRGVPTLEIPKAPGKLLTKHAITATEEEVTDNPRARSARLRVFEKAPFEKLKGVTR